MDHKMIQYCLQREDYWMKTLRTIYLYRLIAKIKFMNKNVPVSKVFPPLPRYGKCFLNIRTQYNIHQQILSSYYIRQFPIKLRSNKCRKLLKSFKKSELKNEGIQIQNNLQYGDFNQKCCEPA